MTAIRLTQDVELGCVVAVYVRTDTNLNQALAGILEPLKQSRTHIPLVFLDDSCRNTFTKKGLCSASKSSFKSISSLGIHVIQHGEHPIHGRTCCFHGEVGKNVAVYKHPSSVFGSSMGNLLVDYDEASGREISIFAANAKVADCFAPFSPLIIPERSASAYYSRIVAARHIILTIILAPVRDQGFLKLFCRLLGYENRYFLLSRAQTTAWAQVRIPPGWSGSRVYTQHGFLGILTDSVDDDEQKSAVSVRSNAASPIAPGAQPRSAAYLSARASVPGSASVSALAPEPQPKSSSASLSGRGSQAVPQSKDTAVSDRLAARLRSDESCIRVSPYWNSLCPSGQTESGDPTKESFLPCSCNQDDLGFIREVFERNRDYIEQSKLTDIMKKDDPNRVFVLD